MVSDRLIQFASPRKRIYVVINNKIRDACKKDRTLKFNHGKYIGVSLEIIDQALGEISVDTSFYDDYYALKSIVDMNNNYLSPALLSALISIVVSLGINSNANFSDPYFASTMGIAIGISVSLIAWLVFKATHSKANNVIYVYILEQMEEMIKTRSQSSLSR